MNKTKKAIIKNKDKTPIRFCDEIEQKLFEIGFIKAEVDGMYTFNNELNFYIEFGNNFSYQISVCNKRNYWEVKKKLNQIETKIKQCEEIITQVIMFGDYADLEDLQDKMIEELEDETIDIYCEMDVSDYDDLTSANGDVTIRVGDVIDNFAWLAVIEAAGIKNDQYAIQNLLLHGDFEKIVKKLCKNDNEIIETFYGTSEFIEKYGYVYDRYEAECEKADEEYDRRNCED